MLQRTLKRCPTALLALLMSWFVVAVPVSAVAADIFPVDAPASDCTMTMPMPMPMPMPMDATTYADALIDCADCDVTACQCPQLLMTHSASMRSAPTFTLPFPELVLSQPDHPNTVFERPPRS